MLNASHALLASSGKNPRTCSIHWTVTQARRLWGSSLALEVATVAGLLGTSLAVPAHAQTLNEAQRDFLAGVAALPGCPGLVDPLLAICAEGGIASSAGNGSAGVTLAPTVVQERLQRIEESEHASRTKETSATTAAELGRGFNVFLSADYEAILKHNNRFEDGYDSGTWGATLGGDYQINNRLIAGLALNYSNEDGEFDDGGGFDTASYRVIAFTSVVPMEGAFVDLTAGYARQHYDRKRRITFTPVGGATTRGTASADFDGNEVSVGTLAGYDHPIDNITVGPRAGLNWIHTQIDSYKEDGDSGLELRFSDLSETSLEGSLGVQASAAIRTAFAVVVPQLNADWVHEFENDQYKRDAYFVYDTLKRRFSFENEEPDRNFARIGLSVSAVLPNGLTPFASFRTIQWNDNQTSYKGVIGLRTEL